MACSVYIAINNMFGDASPVYPIFTHSENMDKYRIFESLRTYILRHHSVNQVVVDNSVYKSAHALSLSPPVLFTLRFAAAIMLQPKRVEGPINDDVDDG